MKLSRIERETLILFNEGEDFCTISAYNPRWQKRLQELAERGVCTIQDDFQQPNCGCLRTDDLPKRLLKLPQAPRKRSEAQKKATSENLKKARAKAKR